jgi:Invasin, domain 3
LQPQRLPADGHSISTMTILLSDWQGIPITHGGATVRVQHQQDSAGSSFIGSVQDHGDGTYTVPITAGFGVGTDLFQVTVDDGISPVQLYPFASLDVAPPLSLRASETEISAGAGDDVRFGLSSTTGFAGREFLLLLSASGTEPGFDHGRVHVPLNADAALFNSLMFANSPPYLGTRSKLDSDGRAAAIFAPDPGMLDPLVGATLSFAYLTLSPDDFCSRPVQILIVP